ncbi:hypothetical protein HanPI659440_Chr17g0684811 [Helianthus annuus]|nr:hypothetical protein HanPI659440_Chr17g0684811 [Helianthus annuus]
MVYNRTFQFLHQVLFPFHFHYTNLALPDVDEALFCYLIIFLFMIEHCCVMDLIVVLFQYLWCD